MSIEAGTDMCNFCRGVDPCQFVKTSEYLNTASAESAKDMFNAQINLYKATGCPKAAEVAQEIKKHSHE